MAELSLETIDQQLRAIRTSATELPKLSDLEWRRLATTLNEEMLSLSEYNGHS
jgi:hypothetical protein